MTKHIGSFFGLDSAPKPKPLPPPPPPTTATDDAAVEQARQQALLAARKAKGRAASLIAGEDTLGAPAPVAQKTLLGA